VLSARRLAGELAWRLKPQDTIGLDRMMVCDGKYVSLSVGARLRLMALVRVRMPDVPRDVELDYGAALRTTLQQQRIRGLFDGLHRAAVPFLYTAMLSQEDQEPGGEPLFQFDLVVGTWVDGKEKEVDDLERTLEQRASILAATLGVAMPTAGIDRLEKGELSGFMRTLLLPGRPDLAQTGPSGTAGALCSFESRAPSQGSTGAVPEFYVPNAAESGRDGILLGAVKSAGGDFHDFRLQVDDLRRHVVILGMTGSGKSTTGAAVVRQVVEAGLPVLVLDWHNEYGAAVSQVGGKVYAPGRDGFSVNPIEAGGGMDLAEQIATVSDIFSDIYHFTHPQAYMFRNALQKRISESSDEESPTLASLVKTIESYPLRSAYDNETKVALLRRLVPLTQGQAGKALGGPGTVPVESVLDSAVCIELGQFRDVQTRAMFADVVLKLIYEQRVRRRSSLEHLTVIEEARNVAPARRQEDPPSVGERMISELRKFGEAMMFVAQFPSQVASEVVKNSGTKIVHRMDWPEDVSIVGDSLGLSVRQREYLTKLGVGEAVVGVARLRSPILVDVKAPPLPSQASSEHSLDAEA
jgi:hypothetical protein